MSRLVGRYRVVEAQGGAWWVVDRDKGRFGRVVAKLPSQGEARAVAFGLNGGRTPCCHDEAQ
jgi:hypothetical protein